MTPPELKWPKPGDIAFREATPPIRQFRLCVCVTPSEASYTLGFRSAADAVIENARQQGNHPDLLFIPVAYLYRHFLELMLKDLVRISMKGNMIVVPDGRLSQHDIEKLWQSARKAIEVMWPASPPDDLNAVEQVIHQFHQFDPHGQAFRYSHDLKGNANLSTAPTWVDLNNLQATMTAVANFLEAAEAGIDAASPGPS